MSQIQPEMFFEAEPPTHQEESPKCSKGWGERCGRSKGPRCRCQCHGHNHGNPKARPKHSFTQHLGHEASTSHLFQPYVAEALKHSPTCRWCSHKLQGPAIGYPHDGGWLVPGLKSREQNGCWWLFVVCENCNYEWALWKLGVDRNWTPE